MLKHCTQKSQWNESLYFSSRSTSWVTQALKNPMNYLDYSSFKSIDIFEKIFVIFILMYQCENWTIDKSWALNNWCYELWCWRRFLRVPGTARRTNQSILKEISPEYSLEGLMLKLQYSGHLMRRTDSFEKTLMQGKIEGRRRSEWQGIR